MSLGSLAVPFSSSDFEAISNKRALLTLNIAQDIPQDLGTDQTSTAVSMVHNLKLINAFKLSAPTRQNFS